MKVVGEDQSFKVMKAIETHKLYDVPNSESRVRIILTSYLLSLFYSSVRRKMDMVVT